ncbi:hypothetical protein DENSPDRAFT_930668 [Dentipellis sp. KUC8613]|nr:hypothetical protein DENSPDRAFT_930668 [Dentipellis sp. KUC8613]
MCRPAALVAPPSSVARVGPAALIMRAADAHAPRPVRHVRHAPAPATRSQCPRPPPRRRRSRTCSHVRRAHVPATTAVCNAPTHAVSRQPRVPPLARPAPASALRQPAPPHPCARCGPRPRPFPHDARRASARRACVRHRCRPQRAGARRRTPCASASAPTRGPGSCRARRIRRRPSRFWPAPAMCQHPHARRVATPATHAPRALRARALRARARRARARRVRARRATPASRRARAHPVPAPARPPHLCACPARRTCGTRAPRAGASRVPAPRASAPVRPRLRPAVRPAPAPMPMHSRPYPALGPRRPPAHHHALVAARHALVHALDILVALVLVPCARSAVPYTYMRSLYITECSICHAFS